MNRIEALAKIFEEAYSKNAADRLRSVGQEMLQNGEITEVLPDTGVYHHPQFDFYTREGVVIVDDEARRLTEGENKLLGLFVRNPNRIIRPVEIIKTLWGVSTDYYNKSAYESPIKSRVYALRRKIASEGNPSAIFNLSGRGYFFRNPEVATTVVDPVVEDEEHVEGEKERIYFHPAFTFYPQRSYLKVGDDERRLTPLENQIVELLVLVPNRIVHHGAFADAGERLHGRGFDKTLIKTHISHIRKKMRSTKSDGTSPNWIVSRHGVGYALIYPEVSPANNTP